MSIFQGLNFFICILQLNEMEGTSNGDEPTSWEDLYNVNLMPSEIFLKFRKDIQGLRVGVNLEVCISFSFRLILSHQACEMLNFK